MLSIFGGATPTELEDRVRPTIDLLQMYGLTQGQTKAANDPASPENGTTGVVLSATQWTVVFAVTATVIKTATVTALRVSCGIRISADLTQEFALASESLDPFGATETGAATVVGRISYPILCPPGSLAIGRIQILGTDATANITVGAYFGTVGP